MYAVKGLAGELDSKIGDGYLIEKLRSSADNKQIC
jgi:hypothetical protein